MTTRNIQTRTNNRTQRFIGLVVLVVMTLMPFAGWGQSLPFEVTTPDDVTNHTEKFYWIESVGATGFYAVPHFNNTNASTTNAPTMRALWYFMESGESGYYYIINKETGTYLKRTGNAGTDNTIQVANYAAADDSKFKFSFGTPQGITEGSWVIYPKDAGGAGWVGKKSGNLAYNNWLKVANWNSTPVGDLNAQWFFVARADVQWPKSGLPFVVSTSSDKHYYRINHAQSTGYNISYDGSNYVTISTELDNKTAWYFEEAATDPDIDNLKYYKIVNAPSEKYLKFTATTINGSNQNDKFTLSDYNAGDADRFQFVVVNSYGGNAGYSIMPKLAMSKYDVSNYANSMVPASVANNEKLDLRSDRNNSNAHWNFMTTEYPMSCAINSITYSSSTGKITITATPADAEIHYTTDGVTEPSSSVGTEYTGPFDVSSTVTIKAIATKTGYGPSEIVTVSFSQVATPTIQNNGSNAISITSVTEGATIYYTTDETTPTTGSTLYTGPLTENVSGVTIKAIAVKDGWINSSVGTGTITLKCARPVITKNGDNVTISCAFPAGVTIRYTKNGGDPTASSQVYEDPIPVVIGDVIKAIAMAAGYENSDVVTKTIHDELTPGSDGKYHINNQTEFETFVDMASTEDGAQYHYVLDANVTAISEIAEPFTGTFDGNYHTITNLSQPFFNTVNGGIVKNVMLKGVNIQSGDNDGDAGAICNKAVGSSRIYNCGILPTGITRDEDGNITGFSGSSVSGTRYVGGLVGLLSGTARVINCYSYANVSGGSIAAGIVGNNNESTTLSSLNTMVMNCMFYGNITDASTKKPVYGGTVISNAGTNGVNNYNYYRNGKGVTFDDNYASFDDYYCTLPADEEYLTRYEYYRSILNCNRKLCVWWITGHTDAEQTAEDGEMMAKWVLDPEIAPFPILKKWGKYPSVINQDKTRVWDPRTKDADGNPLTPHWVNRSSAPDYQGKQLGTINVTVNAGAKHAGTGATSKPLSSVVVMDMDTLNHDYCYAKIQLPYYNEQFGDPTADSATNWDNRYAGNYKDYVVTGWKITGITGGTAGSFKGYSSTAAADAVSAADVTPDEPNANAWEDGFNFADRKCTNKDLYSKSGRVFAQGGYYYVPEGVSAITIEAYWGKAVYLHNKDHCMDRVNVAATADGDGSGDGTAPDFGSAFTPAGTLSTTFQGGTVRTSLQDAITNLPFTGTSYTVYDQAIVLVGNVQVKNRGGSLGRAHNNNGSLNKPFTIMSCDLDFDNEPDYCLQFQQRNTTNRPGVHPMRFDFLPVPELGLAIRTNTFAYAIGLMVPQGHFEITETAFMHTTQFEYDADVNKVESPLILNGGHFEQIVLRRGPKNKTSYIIMGGNFRMKRFTPGYHASNIVGGAVRHCVVNAIGGEYPEFYLSGIYRPDQATLNNDNPHCYTNGGHFGLVAGAGYEQVKGNVTFKIDHSIIREFYGGGINGAKPITGNIDVTINNSLVGKYCGGPKVGSMAYDDNGTTKYRTVTTNATGTTFGVFYGSGNGGTSYYRDPKYDNTREFPTTEQEWITQSGNYTPKFKEFTPLNQESTPAADYSNALGYHAKYEFEVFNASNGLKSSDDVIRLYYHWAQFGSTITGDVTNTLTNCTITGDFFGGGNLGNVTGNVTSTLKGTTHVYGSAFAAGYSASIPSFPAHDKSTVRFPAKDKAGNVAEQGSLDYYQDNGEDRMYTWCYKNTTTGTVLPEGVVIPSGYDVGLKQKSAFRYPDEDGGKWYILTNVSLENLGAVSGNATLTIDENSVIDHDVFGGGDSSAVTGNTTVKLQGNATVLGNVYGGGNEGPVGGDSKVEIQDP